MAEHLVESHSFAHITLDQLRNEVLTHLRAVHIVEIVLFAVLILQEGSHVFDRVTKR